MSERAQLRRNRKKEREEATEQSQSLESTLGGDYISDEAPSEEDIKEAEDLKKDLKEKHKARRRELSRQFRSQSQENLTEESERVKGKTKQKLEDTLKSTAEEKQRRLDKIKKKRDGEKDEEEAEDADEDKDVDTKAEDAKHKRVDRKAIAAALREKSRQRRSLSEMKKEEDLDDDQVEEDETDGVVPIRSMRRDKRMPTRFDKGKTEDIERARRRREKQSKLNKLTPENLRTAGEVPEEDAFDFFTKDWPAKKEIKRTEQPSEDQVDHDDREKTPLLDLDEDEDVPFKSTQYFVGLGRADYIPFEKKKEYDEKFLYTPAVIELQLEQKIEHEPRFIEEEGLYVGRPTVIMPRNRNRLENRLVKEGNMEWFGEDGRVKLLPDPLKEIPTRPALWDEEVAPIPDELKTDYINPILSDLDKKLMNTDQFGQYIVEVDVHSVVFSHHPLFTKEHVLSQRLTELFIQYEKLLERDFFDYCEQRILALKRAIVHLVNQKEILVQHAKARDEEPPITELEERMSEYRKALSKTRKWRNEHEYKIRDTLIKMIETYKLIEKDRAAKGYTATKLHLIIRKESTNKELEEEEERKEISEQVNEKREKYESQYTKLFKKYKIDQKKYEAQKERKKGALDRNKERKELGIVFASAQKLIEEEGEATATSRKKRILMEKEYEDMEILEEEDLECPVEPVPFDLQGMEMKVRENMKKCRRRPGEPIIDVILNDTKTVTSDDICPRSEQQRRAQVSKCSYFVKILFNHKEVGVTDTRSLSSDFIVKFTKIYPIQILQFPEVITLRLFEKSGMSTRQLKDIDMQPPGSQSVTGRVKVEPHIFACTQIADQPKFTSVGSAIKFQFEAEQMKELVTSGKFYSSVAWAVNEEGDVMAPIMDLNNREAMNDVAGSNDPNPQDPNDPRNTKNLNLIKGGQDLDYFRLDHYQEMFNFCTSEDIATSNRYRLLKLRNRGIPEFKNQKIPLSENDVSKDIFKEYDDRRKEKKKDGHVRGFEGKRIQQKYLLDRVRDEVMERFRQSLRQKSLNEVVHEEEIPNLAAFAGKLSQLTEPRRPLKPKRIPRKSVPAQNVSQLKSILVRIVKAENIPIRDGDSVQLVQPMIEVRFQDEFRVTSMDEQGPNPHWNSNFSIPFRPPPKVTSLEQVTDVILINLYDRITHELPSEENIRRIKIEKRWLGSLEIPFNTVFMNTKVMGRFTMTTPDVLLGYKSSSSHTHTSPDSNKPDHSFRPLLETDITIDPLIKPPEPIKDKEFESVEDRGLLRHAEEWLHRMEESKPNRSRKCTVLNMKIKEYFITRYLFKLEPPEDVLSLATELSDRKRAVARYVSLIPYLSDTQAFSGVLDIWSTSEQFLKMLFGDSEEHAVLLYNYFLHLYNNDPKCVYLCLGNAVPEGRAIYVVVKNETSDELEFWNPSSGDCFDKGDSHCPLVSIGSLINPENIWANIQESDEPKDISFDVNNKKLWSPLFDVKESPLGRLATVQEPITYQATNEGDVTDIKMKLENQLQQRIMTWRKGMITKWNYEFIKDLNELLRKLEDKKSSGKSVEVLKNDPIFKKIGSKYKMYGFPMNLPYMDMEEIIERVRATGIHTNNARNLEFAVTTYVRSYSNSVLSIWIYVAYFERL